MITPSQIRAARSFLNLDQAVVADAVGVSKANISDIENEKGAPKGATIDALAKFFELRGVEFTPDGGIRPAGNIIHVYDGPDAYIRLLDDVQSVLPRGGELLKSGADETRSSAEVIEKNRGLRKAGIKMRALVRDGNTHLMAPLEEYRWMDPALYVDGDVKLIYGDRVAYLITWTKIPRHIIIRDKTIAEEQRRQFDYVWGNAPVPPISTAEEKY